MTEKKLTVGDIRGIGEPIPMESGEFRMPNPSPELRAAFAAALEEGDALDSVIVVKQPAPVSAEAIHVMSVSPEMEKEILAAMDERGIIPEELQRQIGGIAVNSIDPMQQFGHGDPRDNPYGQLRVRHFTEADHALVNKTPLPLPRIDVQYFDWLGHILRAGEKRCDRTGTGTISAFGQVMMRVDLRQYFPALTTKYVHFIAVDDELDWMKSGSSNIRSMKKNGTRIWDEWVIPGTEEYRMLEWGERIRKMSVTQHADFNESTAFMREDDRSQEFILQKQSELLDNMGIPDKELVAGELGKVYGTQWRYWEDTRIIEASEWSRDPDGWADSGFVVQGKMFDGHRIVIQRKVDQIAIIEKQIRDEVLFQKGELEKHKDGRRIMLSGWNVANLTEMALPPCHVLAQWYVSSETDENGKHFLDCEMYQRSGDMFLGIPFNMAQYSLLTSQLAHVTGTRARFFTHVIGDAHIYTNHVEQVKEQLARDPYKHEYPQLEITGAFNSILDMKTGDCKLVGYKYDKAIKAKVAV